MLKQPKMKNEKIQRSAYQCLLIMETAIRVSYRLKTTINTAYYEMVFYVFLVHKYKTSNLLRIFLLDSL